MRKRKTPKFPVLLLVVGGFLIMLAALLSLYQGKTSPIGSQSPLPEGRYEEETYPEIERVSLADAKAASDTGSAVFIDVRIAEAYIGGHIPGALNIPLGDLETRLNELDPNQWIITYCT